MGGIQLLLGNDLLQQFKSVCINYESKENPVTLGKPHCNPQPKSEEPKIWLASLPATNVVPTQVEIVKDNPLPSTVNLDVEGESLHQEITSRNGLNTTKVEEKELYYKAMEEVKLCNQCWTDGCIVKGCIAQKYRNGDGTWKKSTPYYIKP